MGISKSTPIYVDDIGRKLDSDSYYKHTYVCKGLEDYTEAYRDIGVIMNRYQDEWCVQVCDVCSESRVVAIILEIIKKQGNT